MADEVLTETRGRVRIITLNRPDAMNAINQALADGLSGAMSDLDADDQVSVGVLAGNGRGFCAGMDLKEFVSDGMPMSGEGGFAGITESPPAKPVIAAVEGFALAGGLEVALACDLLVAAEGAKFGIPETGVGLFAAAGALLRLPRRVPYGVAMKMALTAEPMRAEEAHQYGLVTELAPKGGALDAALALAERVAKNAPLGLKASKALIREMQGRTEDEFWAYQKSFMSVFGSADAIEGATAFAEKREPNWTGN